jgi:hypothetical protein
MAMIKISEHLRASHNTDGAIVLDVAKGKIYGLNPVASRVLGLLALDRSPDQIAAEISREFAVDLATAHRDVEEFLGQLAKYRLIRQTGQAPGGAQ